MALKFRLSLITCLVLGTILHAQENRSRKLSFTAGPSHIARQDLIFSPFIHKDLSVFNIGLKYEKNIKRHQFVRLNYSGFTPGIETPYDFVLDGESETAYLHSFTFVSLDYGQGMYLGNSEKKQSILGVAMKLDVQALDYQYGRASFFGYYSTVGLGLWYKHIFQLNEKQQLTGQIEAPLLSWYARSPYLINDDKFIENVYSHQGVKTFFSLMEDGQIATWDQLQTLNASLAYQYNVSSKWTIGVTYQFAFVHANAPVKLTSFQNGLGVTVAVKL